MPKKIFSDFSGGLSSKDKNISDNQFYVGEKVDIFRNEGYLMPTTLPADQEASAGVPSSTALRGLVVAGTTDPVNYKAYFLSNNGDLYQVTINGYFNDNFDGSDHYYKAIASFGGTNGVGVNDMIFYNDNGTSAIFYSYNTSAGAFVGTYIPSTTTFNDTKLTLTAGTKTSPHPMIEWNSTLWIGAGRYLAKYVGLTNVLTAEALDLGFGWEITSIFSTNNYIGICAWKKGTLSVNTECKVFFWDGTSEAYSYSITLDASKVIGSVVYKGSIYLSVAYRGSKAHLIKLVDNGYEIITNMNHVVDGVLVSLLGGTFQTMSICENRLLIGDTSLRASVLSIGDEKNNEDVITFPYLLGADPTNRDYIGFLKQVATGGIYIGWVDTSATKYYLYTIAPTGTTYGTATYKSGYVDFGQRVKINYIKFYFKPLVASDSLTAGLDVDYGTAKTLGIGAGNISYAKDGAVTSKKFMAGFQCHAFRPTLSWVAGGTQISKIVVDFSYISD